MKLNSKKIHTIDSNELTLIMFWFGFSGAFGAYLTNLFGYIPSVGDVITIGILVMILMFGWREYHKKQNR